MKNALLHLDNVERRRWRSLAFDDCIGVMDGTFGTDLVAPLRCDL